jgi:hypothetical protein
MLYFPLGEREIIIYAVMNLPVLPVWKIGGSVINSYLASSEGSIKYPVKKAVTGKHSCPEIIIMLVRS